MNANWLPQMPAIKDWLADASLKLSKAGISSPNLDAEIILSNCMLKNRTYLHAHPEAEIDTEALAKTDEIMEQRLKRVPLAYLFGYKEFYGREFQVTKDTLIPRPESETIIDILKQINTDKISNLIDIGTGSGCLGISAKLEEPDLDVTLSDISPEALKIAKINADRLKATVDLVESDLLASINNKFDIIIANLPYVDKDWARSPETNYEPSLALFADNSGKQLIEKLVIQSINTLNNGGYLIIEADPEQHPSLIQFATEKSFKLFIQQDYIIAFRYLS